MRFCPDKYMYLRTCMYTFANVVHKHIVRVFVRSSTFYLHALILLLGTSICRLGYMIIHTPGYVSML